MPEIVAEIRAEIVAEIRPEIVAEIVVIIAPSCTSQTWNGAPNEIEWIRPESALVHPPRWEC